MKKKLYGDGRKSFKVTEKIDMRLWFFKPTILFSQSAKIFIPRAFFNKTVNTDFQLYAGTEFLTISEGSKLIRNAIESERAVLFGRFGDTELFACCDYDVRHKMANQNFYRLQANSGYFYKDDKKREKDFYEEYLSAFKNSDALGCWFTIGEDYMIKKYNPNMQLMPLRAYEPWYNSLDPWSAKLKGKNVLVISPFTSTIETQYKKREKLFPGTSILPEFNLQTIRAVNTRGQATDSRFADWFEALDFMKREVDKKEYDVAIVGCGAYSLPLCSYIKNKGKVAIQMGGATQLLFGIIGNRWEGNQTITKLKNENWTRILPEDISTGMDSADKPYS